jgi:predicted GTPase
VHVRERPVLILFNKCDVHLNGETETAVAYKSTFATELNGSHVGELALISTSGKEGTNVERAVRWIVDAITKQQSSSQ